MCHSYLFLSRDTVWQWAIRPNESALPVSPPMGLINLLTYTSLECAPEGNPCGDRESVQTPFRQRRELNPGRWFCKGLR